MRYFFQKTTAIYKPGRILLDQPLYFYITGNTFTNRITKSCNYKTKVVIHIKILKKKIKMLLQNH